MLLLGKLQVWTVRLVFDRQHVIALRQPLTPSICKHLTLKEAHIVGTPRATSCTKKPQGQIHPGGTCARNL